MLFSALKGRGGPTVAPPGETTFARAARLRRKNSKKRKDSYMGNPHQKILKTVGGDRFCVNFFTISRTEIRAVLCIFRGLLDSKSTFLKLLTCPSDIIHSSCLSIE